MLCSIHLQPGLYERPLVYSAAPPALTFCTSTFFHVLNRLFRKVTSLQRPLEFVLKVAVEESKDVFCLGARVLYVCKGVQIKTSRIDFSGSVIVFQNIGLKHLACAALIPIIHSTLNFPLGGPKKIASLLSLCRSQ